MECHCGLGEFGICRNFGKLGWVMSCYLLILSWCLSYHKGYTKKTFQNPNVILYCVLVEINFLDMPTTRACTLRPQLHSDASTLLFLHSKYCSCIGMHKPSWILFFWQSDILRCQWLIVLGMMLSHLQTCLILWSHPNSHSIAMHWLGL